MDTLTPAILVNIVASLLGGWAFISLWRSVASCGFAWFTCRIAGVGFFSVFSVLAAWRRDLYEFTRSTKLSRLRNHGLTSFTMSATLLLLFKSK